MFNQRRRVTRKKIDIPSKYLLVGVVFFSIVAIFVSLNFNISGGPLKTVAETVFGPMQKGLNHIGSYMVQQKDYFDSMDELKKENEELRKKLDELTAENSTLKLEHYELENLRELYALDNKYPSYEKTAARVIAKDASNWFVTFIIDKGSDDGIEVNMNVIAGSGLVGIVTSVGKHSATVTTIINDTSNVSGMMLTTSDSCIVRGNLQSMIEEQVITFDTLHDRDNVISVGEPVVTSNISDKFLQGILIGYVTSVTVDANNLTKSGTITPVVDFEHIEEVLVILETKEID